MMPRNTHTDELKDRTSDFMHALAASDVDAANISADRTGGGTMVHTWLHEEGVEAAEEVASEYGFEFFGESLTDQKSKYNQAAADQGRKRFRFETEEGA